MWSVWSRLEVFRALGVGLTILTGKPWPGQTARGAKIPFPFRPSCPPLHLPKGPHPLGVPFSRAFRPAEAPLAGRAARGATEPSERLVAKCCCLFRTHSMHGLPSLVSLSFPPFPRAGGRELGKLLKSSGEEEPCSGRKRQGGVCVCLVAMLGRPVPGRHAIPPTVSVALCQVEPSR